MHIACVIPLETTLVFTYYQDSWIISPPWFYIMEVNMYIFKSILFLIYSVYHGNVTELDFKCIIM